MRVFLMKKVVVLDSCECPSVQKLQMLTISNEVKGFYVNFVLFYIIM